MPKTSSRFADQCCIGFHDLTAEIVDSVDGFYKPLRLPVLPVARDSLKVSVGVYRPSVHRPIVTEGNNVFDKLSPQAFKIRVQKLQFRLSGCPARLGGQAAAKVCRNHRPNQRTQPSGREVLYGTRTRSAKAPWAVERVLPNPSLKRSANGRPPGPVWRYAVHFRQPGPGVLPSSPA